MASREELERRQEEERRRRVEDAARARAEAEARSMTDTERATDVRNTREYGLDYGDPDMMGRGGVGYRRRVPQIEREANLRRADDERRAGYLDADPTMTPSYTYEDLVDAGASAYGDAAADPDSIEAQRRALEMMRVQAETEGMTPAERSMMQAGIRATEQSARGARQADMQALEARGMGGSGLSMLSGQMASQGAADRAADVGAQTMMAAQQRALQAMESYGNQSANMRGQSFGEAQARASGLDSWNQALADRAQGVQGRNTERYNQGQDQGYANRFQREGLAQSLYQTESQKAENERERSFSERTGRESARNALVGGVIGAVGGTVRGMGS